MRPQERVKVIEKLCNSIEIDPNVPLSRYYINGIEMDSVAHKFLKERSFENAFVLFKKYDVLFGEKVRKHPDFDNIPDETQHIVDTRLEELRILNKCLKEFCLKKYGNERDRCNSNIVYQPSSSRKRSSSESSSTKGETSCQEQIKACQQRTNMEVKVKSPLRGNPRYPTTEDHDLLKIPANNATLAQRGSPWLSIQNCFSPKQVRGFPEYCMRRIILPTNLCKRFLLGAKDNTKVGLETLAFLCGTRRNDEVTITHIVYPKQEGSSSSVAVFAEEQVALIQCKNRLVVYGWIHTHPGQAAYLTPADLHIQYAFQKQCPAFIGIVCAPKFNDVLYATLTCAGIRALEACKQKDLTHPHSEGDLYTKAKHVHLNDAITMYEIDLRDIEPQTQW